MKIENLNKTYVEIIAVTSLIYCFSLILYTFNLLSIFYLVITVFIFTLLLNRIFEYRYSSLTYLTNSTLLLMLWIISISGFPYSVYEFDWNSFAIPINLVNDSNLYLNDVLANQEFPHIYIYKFVAFLIEKKMLSEVFFIVFILQNYFFAKSFLILKSNIQKDYSYIVYFPLFFYPQLAGHYVSLPYFIPTIFGFSLSLYLISKFIFSNKQDSADFLLFFILLFIHPFWAIFTPLFLLMCHLLIKDKINSSILFSIFLLSLFLNDLDGISFTEILKGDLINFYKTYVKIHFDWRAHYGFLFKFENNNIYQQLTMFIFISAIFSKKKLINFKSKQSIFFMGLFFISLIIVTGNYFYDSSYNNYLISSNFYRLGTLTWFFSGVFILNFFSSKYSYIAFISIPLIGLLFSYRTLFIKELGILPGVKFNSKLLYLIILFSLVLILFNINNKYKKAFFTVSFGLGYLLLFYFVDKVVVNNYLIKASLIISLFLFIFYFLFLKTTKKRELLLITIFILFCSSFESSPILLKNINFEYKNQIDARSIILIKENTTNKDVILVDPSYSNFRKETQRGIVFDYSLIPYNNQNLKIFLDYKSLFNEKTLKNMKAEEILNISRKSGATDVILPNDSLALLYFMSNYSYIELADLGYLFKDINK